ncbi:MAG: MBL fold metallo-hydrolase [Clostridia bacterium]|nr:MBL fold metallo-hydrolase [Clostridia bacterium]
MFDIKITDVRERAGDSAFLIDDGVTAILYDSGFAFTGYAVAERIKKALGKRSLDFIFLTHSHYDHALGSCYVLEYYPEAKVVAGSYATKIFAKDSAKSVMRDLDKKFATACGINEYDDLVDNLRVDIAVDDGDCVKAGDMTFRVFSLPGHTKCSVGYYCEEKKLLLGCETLGVFDGEGGVVPAYLVGYEMTLKSIQRMQQIEIDRVLVPHYGLLDCEQTKTYLSLSKTVAQEVGTTVVKQLECGMEKTEIIKQYIDRYWKGYIKDIYPIDAITLNTSIMVDLLERELLGKPTVD